MSSRSTNSSQEHSHSSKMFGHSKFSYDYDGGDVYCYCGLKAPLITSTCDENPGSRPVDNQHVKALIIDLRNRNKELSQENSIPRNENRYLSKMLAEFKVENECLRNMSYAGTHEELSDEVAALKPKNLMPSIAVPFIIPLASSSP
ncbi:hypothetical protein DITRI_Ditri18aG0049500 [Diplodiscus trichospermus]